MAGPDPAIHGLPRCTKNVDARGMTTSLQFAYAIIWLPTGLVSMTIL